MHRPPLSPLKLLCAQMYVYVYTSLHTYVSIHTPIRIHLYACSCTRAPVCIRMCTYICIHAYKSSQRIVYAFVFLSFQPHQRIRFLYEFPCGLPLVVGPTSMSLCSAEAISPSEGHGLRVRPPCTFWTCATSRMISVKTSVHSMQCSLYTLVLVVCAMPVGLLCVEPE